MFTRKSQEIPENVSRVCHQQRDKARKGRVLEAVSCSPYVSECNTCFDGRIGHTHVYIYVVHAMYINVYANPDPLLQKPLEAAPGVHQSHLDRLPQDRPRLARRRTGRSGFEGSPKEVPMGAPARCWCSWNKAQMSSCAPGQTQSHLLQAWTLLVHPDGLRLGRISSLDGLASHLRSGPSSAAER